MDKIEYIDKLIEYRCILESEKPFFLKLFDDFVADEFKIIEGDYHVVDKKGIYYPANKLMTTIFNKVFESTYYEGGCHFNTESDNDYSYFYCNSNSNGSLDIVEFDYAYKDDSGYYSYVYRNHYVYFMYLSSEKAAGVDFEKWKYNFKLNDERDNYGVELDINDAYAESDVFDEIRAILSDPTHHGIQKLEEYNRPV